MVKVSYFPLTKFSGVAKHLKIIYFPENILQGNKHSQATSLKNVIFENFIPNFVRVHDYSIVVWDKSDYSLIHDYK